MATSRHPGTMVGVCYSPLLRATYAYHLVFVTDYPHIDKLYDCMFLCLCDTTRVLHGTALSVLINKEVRIFVDNEI
jgi:hypothetical protein